MKLTRKEVEYVAALARLELSADEKDRYADQLGAVLTYIDQLSRLDTASVPPTSHVVPLANVWREDVVRPADPAERERLLANAPEREGDYFRVKKVIE